MPNNDYGKVKARLQKLTEKNDIKGLVDMMEDISADQCRRIENGTVEVRTEEYDAVCDYMESLAAQNNEKSRKQLENIYTEVDKRFNVSLIKTGLKADQIYEQIQNKELPGSEHITDEKIARQLSYPIVMGMPVGTEHNAIANLKSVVKSSMSSFEENEDKMIDEMREVAGAEFENNVVLENGVTKEQYERYRKCLSGNDAGTGFLVNEKNIDGMNTFLEYPKYTKKIMDLGDNELKDYKQQLVTDIKGLEHYENTAVNMRENSKKLFEELKANSGEQPSKACTELCDSLENLSKVGNGEMYWYIIDPNEKKPMPKKDNNSFNFTGITYSLNDIKEKAEAYAKENPNFAQKVQNFVNEETPKINQEYKKAEDIFTRDDKNYSTIERKEKTLKKVNIELDKREMQEKFPLSYDEISDKRKEYTKREIQIASIEQFSATAQRGIDAVGEWADAMKEDGKTHKNPSQSYTDFTNELDKLSKMKAENTEPLKLLEQMQTTAAACQTYEEKHTGWRHPFSGWSDDGKARIDNARNVREILELKIRQLSQITENIQPLKDGDTPAKILPELKKENEQVRKDANQNQAEMSERLQESRNPNRVDLDEKLKKTQENIRSKKTENNVYPDKNELADDYAAMIAVNFLKLERKNENEQISEVKFNNRQNNVKNSEIFKDMLKDSNDKTLFEKATYDKGQNLWSNFYQKYSFRQAEKNNTLETEKIKTMDMNGSRESNMLK